MKQNCRAITSPKKQTNEFVLLSWWLRNTWNLKLKFKFQVFPDRQDRKRIFVFCFLGEVMVRQFCFKVYWPLPPRLLSCSKLFNAFYRPCAADQVLLVVWWIDCILHHLSSVYFVGSRLENIIVWYDDDMFWAGSSRRNLFKSRLPTPPYAMPYALLLSVVMRGHKNPSLSFSKQYAYFQILWPSQNTLN